MTTEPLTPSSVGFERSAKISRPVRLLLVVVGFVSTAFVASKLLSTVGTFPQSWNIGLADPLNDARRWLIDNQTSHWLYSVILDPFADTIDGAISALESVLSWIPWFAYILWALLGLWWVRGPVAGILAAAAVASFGLVELWDEGLDTLSLMSVAVVICALIGIPLGVASSRSDRTQRFLRPVLDAMQTMPGFVYLIPFVLLFGIGLVPSIISTVIFALAPIVRATDLGIRGVDSETVEASEMFGATERQTLIKVRLPLARPAVLVGLNQTINLAISMVVIAALIGAGGLGQEVLRSLRALDVGRAAEAGIVIVFMAILLDRFVSGLAGTQRFLPGSFVGAAAGVVAAITIIGGLLGYRSFPGDITFHFASPIDSAVDWVKVNLFEIGNTGLGTGPFSDFVTIRLITPLRELLAQDIPWPVLIALFAATAFGLAGWRLAVGVSLALAVIGLLGMWELSMDTLAQTLVALVITLAMGIPIGVIAGRNDTVRALLRPVLDLLQTIPSLVLLVPFVMLINVGRVPGVIASVMYSIAATIHYTDLGLRSVPKETIEASTSFGATPMQRLRKVELPLAGPEILVAVNQTIMLILAMVVIAGLFGGGGLGLEIVRALRRTDNVGRGFEAGIAIVLLAYILDRLTHAAADRLKPPG